jgi:undecaprenyl phosphate-alpha-L-ara4N flippase subunit ArnF
MPAKPMNSDTLVSNSRRIALWGVLLSAALNAAGQVLFKAARLAYPDASLITLFLHVETWAGFAFYGVSAACWLWVLSRTPLSFAYPILSLTFPIVVALSTLLFAESFSITRWAGVGVIVIGVSLLSKT